MTAPAGTPTPTPRATGALTAGIDLSATPRVPFSRLVAVELRKMWDTRAGFWLLFATAGMLVAVGVIALLVGLLSENASLTASGLLRAMTVPVSLLLPVLAITCVTSEWSQRTGLVSFALEPHRLRVIGAKFVTVLLLGLITFVVAFVAGAVTNLLYGLLSGDDAVWTLSGRAVAATVGVQVLFFVMAFGFGLLLLNTPGAIAIYYVIALLLPLLVYGPVYGLVSWGPDVVPWIDLTFAADPLTMPETDVTAKMVAQLVVTTLTWVGLPIALGMLRVSRAEVK